MLRVFRQLLDEPLHVAVSCALDSGGRVCEIRVLLVVTDRGQQEACECGARDLLVLHLGGREAR